MQVPQDMLIYSRKFLSIICLLQARLQNGKNIQKSVVILCMCQSRELNRYMGESTILKGGINFSHPSPPSDAIFTILAEIMF